MVGTACRDVNALFETVINDAREKWRWKYFGMQTVNRLACLDHSGDEMIKLLLIRHFFSRADAPIS